MPGSASWLLAPPQTTRARRAATVSSSRAPPRALGLKTSRSEWTSSSVSSTARTPAGSSARRRSTASRSTSVTTTSAPSSRRCSASRAPTLPTPAMPTVRPARLGSPQSVLGSGPHPLEDAEGGEHRGVTGPAALGRAAGGPPRLLADHVHVRDVGADVARGDVPPAEGLDEPAVGVQQLGGLVRGGVADDHGLAAAVVEARDGVLVRHRPGEAQHVGERRVHRRVGVEAGAAQARAERGVVERDDGAKAGLSVGAEDDLLVAGEVDEVEGHGPTLDPRRSASRRTAGGLRRHLVCDRAGSPPPPRPRAG